MQRPLSGKGRWRPAGWPKHESRVRRSKGEAKPTPTGIPLLLHSNSCVFVLLMMGTELKASWGTVSTMGGVPDHSKRSSAWCAGELGVQPELPSQTLSQNKVKIGLQYSGRTHA